MPGLARIRRRRADGSPQAQEPRDAPGIDAPTTENPAAGQDDGAPGTEVTAAQATAVAAPPAPPDLPAGAEPAAPRPGFRERGRLRRRLRYLRRLRELGFRDLGGLLFDLDRFGRSREDLVRGKLDALAAVDAELRALEAALDEGEEVHELHEPGISACPRCGALHGSEARYCPSCGLHLHDGCATDLSAIALPPADAAPGQDAAPAGES